MKPSRSGSYATGCKEAREVGMKVLFGERGAASPSPPASVVATDRVRRTVGAPGFVTCHASRSPRSGYRVHKRRPRYRVVRYIRHRQRFCASMIHAGHPISTDSPRTGDEDAHCRHPPASSNRTERSAETLVGSRLQHRHRHHPHHWASDTLRKTRQTR